MPELDDLVKEFLVESHENLDQLDRDLVVLEQEPRNRDRLASIFRTIHTIKGTCGFFGFANLEAVTHAGENLLSKLRDGAILLDPAITTTLLTLVDAVRAMLAGVENTGSDGADDYQELIARLTQLQEAAPGESTPAPESRPAAPQTIGEILVQVGKVKPEQVREAVEQQLAGDPLHVGEILVEKNIVKFQDIREAVAVLQEGRGTAVAETSVRVDVGLLDRLMNLVGELVLARNQILRIIASQKDATLLRATQRLNLITTELQEGVMKTRMQPIGNVWNRFPRVVRDLATLCGKQVHIEVQGKETELDRTVLEAIKDPLTHVVRNAVDHGIEPPGVRKARGKPAEGCLSLRAFHEGGQVNIEIRDDGAGIDPEKVKAKALARGLISREQAARLSDHEAMHLIFLPGFSTAEKVTSVSGRGVGMDVVKTNIEKIGGMVDVQSQPGEGTTLKIKIPLTLAIIPALIVTSGDERYAIPQASLLELVRLEGAQAHRCIEMIHGAPVYRLRGNLLPLVYLDRALRADGLARTAVPEVINIVVLQADDRPFGLVVGGIHDTEEIVVKPLGKQLKGIPVFASATVMGDGKVALILDVMGIAQRAGVVAEARDRVLAEAAVKPQERGDSRQALLLLGVGKGRRLAVPLAQVDRLEEIPVESVEKADGQEVVQYRGRILPLLRLAEMFGGADGAVQDPMQVVVYAEQGHSVGLVVDRILDIVETTLDVRPAGRRAGVRGSAIIQERVTDLLDIQAILGAAPAGFETRWED